MELLLQKIEDGSLGSLIKFTFQYGATSTIDSNIFYVQGNTFTFQYGATSTTISVQFLSLYIKFTFQYGATSTEAFSILENLGQIFTFQYGATSTAIKCTSIETITYLHSNMELLLPL